MIGFELLRPGLSWLPPLGLLLLAVGLWSLARRRAALAAFVAPVRRRRFLPDASRTRPVLRVGLAAAAFAMLGLAVLGPVRGHTEREAARRGLDLVVCIDTSRSMLAEDLRPNRLERAKREVQGLLDRLRDDRCALIAFSGDAREVAPLTRDRRTLRELLRYVGPEDNRLGGTDLAAAIERGLELFDGRSGAHEAIVLLTDGEDHEGRTSDVVREASERGIRVFVVGVGTAGGGKIPVRDARGERFLTGPDGAEVVSRLEGESLAHVARSTGGEYLDTEHTPTPLEELWVHRISTLEGREHAGGLRRVPHDRYQWPLVLALACMLAEGALRERRGGRRAPRLAAFLPLLVVPVPDGTAPGEELATLARLHGEGELEEVVERADALLAAGDEGELPENVKARVHFVRGLALAPSEEPERRAEAERAFASARALAGPGPLRLDATYDQGVVRLSEAEALRTLALSPPPAPPAPPAGTAPPPAPEDPLALARAAYAAAREVLLERLRADWTDADTRANLELIQRRLRELDELEEERQESPEEEPSEGEGDPQEGEPEEGQEGEEGEPGEEGEEGGEPQPQDEPGEDGEEGEQGDREGDPPPQEPESGETGEGDAEPRTEEVPRPEEGGEEPEDPPGAAAGEPAERHLTKEEVMRLLDRLAEIDEEGRALREALRQARRVPVERDW